MNREELLNGLDESQQYVATRKEGKFAVLAGSGSGKALLNGSLVQTPNGPVAIEELQIGDKVFGTDGKTYEVEGVYPQGAKQVYIMEFNDGSEVFCCKDHLWTINDSTKENITLSVEDILNKYTDLTEISLPAVSPVQYNNPIIQYDNPIVLYSSFEKGYLSGVIANQYSISEIIDLKNILYTDVSSREEFLKGFVSYYNYELNDKFVATLENEEVTHLVKSVMHSLGMPLKVTQENNLFYLHFGEITKLKLVNITKLDFEKEMTCISVSSPNHLFLTGLYIPTHNTRVITYRVALLMDSGVKPWEIVSISFTNKAAKELTERIVNLVGERGADVNTGTFHSLCARILLRNQSALNIDNLTILSETDALKIQEEIAASYGYEKESLQEVIDFINYCGTEGIYPEDYEEYSLTETIKKDLLSIHTEYTNHKLRVGYVDFDDLLGLTHRLFKLRPDILEKYASQYRYVMCDEIQDNSKLQMKLMKMFASVHGNYMMVGDENQSIYGFRGASVTTFIDMVKNDDEIETILLEKNYRSTNNIVSASNALVDNNTMKLGKVSYTENHTGHPIFLYEADDDLREAEYVVKMIKGLINTKKYNYSDIMILYRTNFLGQNMSFALSNAGIPHDIQQGASFYEREVIKTLVSYLRLIENPLDDIALEYIINKPNRKIGDATLSRIKMYAATLELPLSAALEYADDIPKLNKKVKEEILKFDAIIKKTRELSRKTNSVVEILTYLIKETHFMSQFDVSKTKDLNSIELVQELFSIAQNFDKEEKNNEEGSLSILTQFLTATALYISNMEEDTGRVSLMTVHGSKGLEAKVVFIIGMQQGTFPSHMSRTDMELEEERRLMYVAMTRAEQMLFISYNKLEYRYSNVERAQKSMFIEEIPESFVKRIGKNA